MSADIHARLTDVVNRIHAICTTDLIPIRDEIRLELEREVLGGEFDKRVFRTLEFSISQFVFISQSSLVFVPEFTSFYLHRKKILDDLRKMSLEFTGCGEDILRIASFYQRCNQVLCRPGSTEPGAD